MSWRIPDHSWCNASIGAIDDARRAGKNEAKVEVEISSSVIPRMMSELCGLVPVHCVTSLLKAALSKEN
jgi:microcompartment protein CcmL/EutN